MNIWRLSLFVLVVIIGIVSLLTAAPCVASDAGYKAVLVSDNM